jgi:hypothetical protein
MLSRCKKDNDKLGSNDLRSCYCTTLVAPMDTSLSDQKSSCGSSQGASDGVRLSLAGYRDLAATIIEVSSGSLTV